MLDTLPVDLTVTNAPVNTGIVPAATLNTLIQRCAPQIHPDTLMRIVATESAGNPYAIGVVGGRLQRQPRHPLEAVATARALQQQGINFSAGLGQINRSNWRRLGLDETSVFEPCRNLAAAQAVLRDCFERAPAWRQVRQYPFTAPAPLSWPSPSSTPAPLASRSASPRPSSMHEPSMDFQGSAPHRAQQALRLALSCYYSGNFSTGFDHGYVAKVVTAPVSSVRRKSDADH